MLKWLTCYSRHFASALKESILKFSFRGKKKILFFFKETLAKGRAPWSGGEQSKTEIRKYPLP